MTALPPIALFAYRRADLLERTLGALKANAVTLIHAFSDGAATGADEADVQRVRTLLRSVDWAEVRLVERPGNLGLGASIVSGVSAVLARHDSVIVCEDDLVAVPGTVAWMAAALERYRDDARVMSVGAWTHPRVTPPDVGSSPFFSARVNTLFWGTWARAWRGMESGTAADRLAEYAAAGGDIRGYGADIPLQANVEKTRNIWAVRFIAQHLARGGLSVCPPWTMVEHIGYDPRASNAVYDPTWYQDRPRVAAPIPSMWPDPVEHPAIARLWREAVDVELRASATPTLLQRALRRLRRLVGADR